MTRIYAKQWKPSKTLVVVVIDFILIGLSVIYILSKQQVIKTNFVFSVVERPKYEVVGPLSDALQFKKRLTCPL